MNIHAAAFEQILDPVGGSLAISAILAALPLLLLFVLLGVFRMKAYQAAIISLALSIVLAAVAWRMPVGQVASATALGAFYAVFPILWILINALWIYKLTVATPWFEVLGRTIRSISDDLRILSILIAFCFGALLESLAGFGAPVAIAAAMLMAAGMKPLKSAVVALLANTAPVAFGAMAAPIIALNGVTGIPLHDLSSMTGRQTPFIALGVPLMLVPLPVIASVCACRPVSRGTTWSPIRWRRAGLDSRRSRAFPVRPALPRCRTSAHTARRLRRV